VTAAVFELGGALAPALPGLEVGPWATAPPGLVAFDGDPGHAESVWRVALALDDAASRDALADGERSVARDHAALDDVARRLERALAALARTARAAPPPRAGDPAPALLAPESELITALAGAEPGGALRAGALTAWSADPAAASGDEPGWLERALERVADLTRGRARIETRVDGALVAHSIMTLAGHTELWIGPRLGSASAGLHARSVAVAVRTRHAWARILALVVAGCGRIAALGLPTGGAAALLLVWRFVRDVLGEVRALTAVRRVAM